MLAPAFSLSSDTAIRTERAMFPGTGFTEKLTKWSSRNKHEVTQRSTISKGRLQKVTGVSVWAVLVSGVQRQGISAQKQDRRAHIWFTLHL